MFNGRESWAAFRSEVQSLPDKYETAPYKPDDETTCVVVRDGDTFTVHVCCVDRDSHHTYFERSEAFDVHGAIGAAGAL